MSELLLELFTEEMPSKLQVSARENLLNNIVKFLDQEEIIYDKNFFATSTPNRLIIYFKDINNEIIKKSKEIKGPNVTVNEGELKGFLKSNNIPIKKVYKKKLQNKEFYFYKSLTKKVKTRSLLEKNFPSFLNQISWKKSMRWGNYDLFWGRPLKLIMAIYGGNALNFKFHHLKCSNATYIDKNTEDKKKSFKNFISYKKFFKNYNIIVNHDERRNFIEKKIAKIAKLNNYKIQINQKLINEVTNIVEKPRVFLCSFSEQFLQMPQEVIIKTIEYHQKFFLLYKENKKLINKYLIVTDCEDKKGLIREGYERVVHARLTDAKYFWNNNKSKNLIKQVFQLRKINYFNGLGNYFEKVQRLKKLGGLISDELLISKEKVEIASTICKVDLLSELVNEFPEMQGTLGGYFAEAQGFEKEVYNAVKEQYLPTGADSKVPSGNYSIALSISDKIDTLVGFFGLELMPSSSKDPYALRRLTIGLIRIVIENKKNFKLRELIRYSHEIYKSQSIDLKNKNLIKDLTNFILERFKNFMKDKNIRQDIIETSVINFDLDNILTIYNKAYKLNKIINKEIGFNLIENYKRASNIINSDISKIDDDSINTVDPALFKNNFEKDLFKKLNDVRKNFTNIKVENDFETQLILLSSIKIEIKNFFDNVIVNDNDDVIKNNRLQLLKLVCKTFDNYFSFEKIESAI